MFTKKLSRRLFVMTCFIILMLQFFGLVVFINNRNPPNILSFCEFINTFIFAFDIRSLSFVVFQRFALCRHRWSFFFWSFWVLELFIILSGIFEITWMLIDHEFQTEFVITEQCFGQNPHFVFHFKTFVCINYVVFMIMFLTLVLQAALENSNRRMFPTAIEDSSSDEEDSNG